jgi:hypothetical protein
MSWSPGQSYQQVSYSFKSEPTKWCIVEPGCTNAIVTGFIEMEGA